VRAARYERHIVARLGKRCSESSADAAGTNHRDPHGMNVLVLKTTLLAGPQKRLPNGCGKSSLVAVKNREHGSAAKAGAGGSLALHPWDGQTVAMACL
jgi:hypothetical protein